MKTRKATKAQLVELLEGWVKAFEYAQEVLGQEKAKPHNGDPYYAWRPEGGAWCSLTGYLQLDQPGKSLLERTKAALGALLVALLVASSACGTVESAPLSAKNDAGGNSAAGVSGGTTDGAAGGAGTNDAGGAGGNAVASSAGSWGSSGSTGAGGSIGGSSGTGGAGGAPLGVTDVPACPYDWSVVRGCLDPATHGGKIVNGSPCDVCHDSSGALLRCSTDPRPGARIYCVSDCSQCF
ncbi:MAG TPA: hypothetical protein VFJ64_10690 [Solirubrobacterales bacterium]|nr:hypothetical protein [Solirubrobacterales bacterium]